MHKEHIHWFTFLIEHLYFNNKECTVFDLIPLQQTQRTLKNYGIRFQKFKNQYLAYAEAAPSKKIWDELAYADDLFFQLINTDATFDNYTDVALPKKANTILYATNEKVVNRFANQPIITVKNTLPIGALRFSVPVSKEKSVSVIIKSNGQEIFNQVSPEKQSTAFIDIQVHGTGVYELWIDNELANTFFGTSERLSTNCYGILHINMRNAVESLRENTLPIVQLHFDARATFREYVVIIPKEKKIDIKNMEIESANNEKYGDVEQKKVLGNEEASNVFTTTNAIPLYQKAKEHSVLKIQYANQFSDVVTELDIPMPVPSATSLITKQVNNENVYYSQTIIYV